MYCFPASFYVNLLFLSWIMYQTVSDFDRVFGTKQFEVALLLICVQEELGLNLDQDWTILTEVSCCFSLCIVKQIP